MMPLPTPSPRRWFIDLICAVAFFILAFYLTRWAKNLGPVPAIFVLVITGASGYAFARSAWQGVLGSRSEHEKRLPERNAKGQR
jgi:hypothetical protein